MKDLLEQRVQAATEQISVSSGKRTQRRERGLKVQPGTDPMTKAFERSVELRSKERSRLREQSRTKLRLQRKQEIQEILDEFGEGEDASMYSMIDLECSSEMLEQLGMTIEQS